VSAPDDGRRLLLRLDGARGLAALGVFTFHFSLLRLLPVGDPLSDAVAGAFANAGWFAVTFFCVLSGFLYGRRGRTSERYGSVLGRRLSRVYPLHVVTLLIAVVQLGGAADWPALLANALLVQSYVPIDRYFFGYNNPSWFLSLQVLFYVAAPWVAGPVSSASRRGLRYLVGGCVAVAWAVPLVASLLPSSPAFGAGNLGSPSYLESIPQFWAIYIFPPTRLADFFVGVACARLLTMSALPRIHPRSAYLILLVSYTVSLAVPFNWQLNALAIVPVTVVVVSLAQTDSEPTPSRSFLTARPLISLGRLSFALYLCHFLVLRWLVDLLDGAVLSWSAFSALYLAALAASIVAAYLAHHAVERPASAWYERHHGAAVVTRKDPRS
jgi:peptidoglycan/LPS O-acetylase OafA/YrhL